MQGLGPGTPKGTEVGKPGHVIGVDVKQWLMFGLGELGGTGVGGQGKPTGP